MPWAKDDPNVFYYSYNYGNIHFIVLDFENNFLEGSDQYIWLKNDLRSVNREVSHIHTRALYLLTYTRTHTHSLSRSLTHSL
jgi:hypothetical protein